MNAIIRSMLIVVLVLLAATLASPIHAASTSPVDRAVGAQAELVPTDDIESYWRDLSDKYGGYFPDNQIPSFREMLTPGGEGLSTGGVMKGMLRFFFFEIVQSGKLLVSIIVLTVFSTILQTLQNAFERTSISKVAYAICYLIIMIIAINSFHVAIGYARSAIESMIHFMTAMIPLLLTLLASIGNIATVSVLHPFIVFSV